MLWSAPRSRSTAFFRMMAQRGDCTVVHEPFSYLAEFGYADVGGVRVFSAAELLDGLRAQSALRPVFAKETTGRRYREVLGDAGFLGSDARRLLLLSRRCYRAGPTTRNSWATTRVSSSTVNPGSSSASRDWPECQKVSCPARHSATDVYPSPSATACA